MKLGRDNIMQWKKHHSAAMALTLAAGFVLLVIPLAARAAAPAKKTGIDPVQAAKYFQEAKAISDKDGGRMWGVPLYGAMMFVDPSTRQVVANSPDYKNILKQDGKVYTGTLPSGVNIANTSVRWGGVDWTMVKWPLPKNRLQRDVLLIHESFHRIQGQLGLNGPDTSCNFLDTRNGRVWIQLEWRALETALMAPKKMQHRAIEDALIFRAYRRSLFKDAAKDEQALEMHEGMPQYTGVALSARSRKEALGFAAGFLQYAPTYQTFVRSFAYASGPAYGLLLDEYKPHWQRSLKLHDDLGTLLANAAGIKLPKDLKAEAEKRAAVYGGKALMKTEDERAQKKAKQTAAMRARFVEGPVLTLPMTNGFNYSFNPTNQIPLKGSGTVYPYLRVSAQWGILEAKHGALMLTNNGQMTGIRVTAPKDSSARPLEGDGWSLTLNPGWSVVPAKRKGDFKVVRALGPLPLPAE